jgi:hypothetical protein
MAATSAVAAPLRLVIQSRSSAEPVQLPMKAGSNITPAAAPPQTL